jgi:hypothetical protein
VMRYTARQRKMAGRKPAPTTIDIRLNVQWEGVKACFSRIYGEGDANPMSMNYSAAHDALIKQRVLNGRI